MGVEVDLSKFNYGGINLVFPNDYHRQYIREIFLLDVYNSRLIKNGDTVLDLGASCGDFSFLASKLTEGKVIAIEPNVEDFTFFKQNLENNKIKNIIPLNIGVGQEGLETITYRGKTYSFQTKPIENILSELQISKVDFIKMDIEGYEVDVIKSSRKIFENARVVALEYHNTREAVDSLLLNMGYKFYPIHAMFMLKNILKNIVPHPLLSFETITTLIKNNPALLSGMFKGYDTTKDPEGIYNGLYIKH